MWVWASGCAEGMCECAHGCMLYVNVAYGLVGWRCFVSMSVWRCVDVWYVSVVCACVGVCHVDVCGWSMFADVCVVCECTVCEWVCACRCTLCRCGCVEWEEGVCQYVCGYVARCVGVYVGWWWQYVFLVQNV